MNTCDLGSLSVPGGDSSTCLAGSPSGLGEITCEKEYRAPGALRVARCARSVSDAGRRWGRAAGGEGWRRRVTPAAPEPRRPFRRLTAGVTQADS